MSLSHYLKLSAALFRNVHNGSICLMYCGIAMVSEQLL